MLKIILHDPLKTKPNDFIQISSINSNLIELNWIDRGNWLVLLGYADLLDNITNTLTLLELLKADYLSPEFRLWICWDPERHFRPSCVLLENARSFCFERVHSVDDCISQFTQSAVFEHLTTENVDNNNPKLRFIFSESPKSQINSLKSNKLTN